jgi:hypothetical protein
MNYFVKEWWWCVVRPSKEEEWSVLQIFLRLSTYNQSHGSIAIGFNSVKMQDYFLALGSSSLNIKIIIY